MYVFDFYFLSKTCASSGRIRDLVGVVKLYIQRARLISVMHCIHGARCDYFPESPAAASRLVRPIDTRAASEVHPKCVARRMQSRGVQILDAHQWCLAITLCKINALDQRCKTSMYSNNYAPFIKMYPRVAVGILTPWIIFVLSKYFNSLFLVEIFPCPALGILNNMYWLWKTLLFWLAWHWHNKYFCMQLEIVCKFKVSNNNIWFSLILRPFLNQGK